VRRLVLFAIVGGCTVDVDDGRETPATTVPASIGSGAETTSDDTDATSSESSSTSTSTSTTTTSSTTDPSTTMMPTTDPSTTDGGEVGCPALGGEDCSPGNGSGEGDTCVDGTPCFIDLVQQGVQNVIAAHPEWFDMADPTLVLDAESYMNAVVADVGAQGVCAIRDPNAGDEMAVKHDNGFAESYDILTADGHARYGELIYTATCSPAWF
jgi:hypothetical protein